MSTPGVSSERGWNGWRYVNNYTAIHARLRRMRGPASNWTCVDCGTQAKDWSYNHTDADELTNDLGSAPHSPDLSCYQPRCGPCHRIFDNEQRQKRPLLMERIAKSLAHTKERP